MTCNKVSELHDLLVQLLVLIKDDYPIECELLRKRTSRLVGRAKIGAYDFGAIQELISLLVLRENCAGIEQSTSLKVSRKRIFISHSSKDKQYITKFVNQILCLGVGVSPDDVFCTSIEDLGINNGEDIRNHIHDNIRSAEYSFLMISDNYKASEICINEMGAVWAYDANVRLYLLPNTTFSSIGWLCDPRKPNKLYDSVVLERLYNEMKIHFNLPNNIDHWSQQRETFLRRR